jgi:hypothetical protein
MKTLIMIILCSLPLIGWGQTSNPKGTYVTKTTTSCEELVKVQRVYIENLQSLAIAYEDLIKALEHRIEVMEESAKYKDRQYNNLSFLCKILTDQLKEQWRLDSIKKAQQFMEDDGIVFEYPIEIIPLEKTVKDTLKPIIK